MIKSNKQPGLVRGKPEPALNIDGATDGRSLIRHGDSGHAVHALEVSEADKSIECSDLVQTILNESESEKLSVLEDNVRNGLNAFYSIGLALGLIRDERLYRQSFANFNDYCRKQWGFDKTYVHRMINAARFHQKLVERVVTIGTNIQVPTAESQLRPLLRLNVEDSITVWIDCASATPGKMPTARQIASRVEEKIKAIRTDSPKPPALGASAEDTLSKQVFDTELLIKRIRLALKKEIKECPVSQQPSAWKAVKQLVKEMSKPTCK